MFLEEFSLEVNRSERAKQVDLLAPLLWNPKSRQELLLSLNEKDDKLNSKDPILEEEALNAKAFHFVWILRDSFFYEREKCAENMEWDGLRERWHKVLGLGNWALEPGWWRHPKGSYNNDTGYIVHPCNRAIGWTQQGIKERINFFEKELKPEKINELVHARQIMNTECDCFIQTPRRFIVIECKDKTGFTSKQRVRQKNLFDCIKRLMEKNSELIYVEISSRNSSSTTMWWSWDELKKIRGNMKGTI